MSAITARDQDFAAKTVGASPDLELASNLIGISWVVAAIEKDVSTAISGPANSTSQIYIRRSVGVTDAPSNVDNAAPVSVTTRNANCATTAAGSVMTALNVDRTATIGAGIAAVQKGIAAVIAGCVTRRNGNVSATGRGAP